MAEPPGESGPPRGRTRIADRVVEKIARQAAAGASIRTGGGLIGGALPAVVADIAGTRARLEVKVAAPWPRPATETAGAVRDRVRDDLLRLAGISVDDLVVTVADVVLDPVDTRRVR